MEGEMLEGYIPQSKGVWEQLHMSDFKLSIYDENGDRIPATHEEWMEFMLDYSPETVRRKILGYSKTVERGMKMLNEVFTEMQTERNLDFVIRTGRGGLKIDEQE